MALLASLSYPIGWIYVRRTLAGSSHSHLSLTGAQLLLATLQLAVVTPLFTGDTRRASPSARCSRSSRSARWARASRSCSSTAWSPRSGPTTAQMVTYFIPVIATVAGVTLLGETLTWSTPVGAVIVLAGRGTHPGRPPPRRAEPRT